MPVILCSIFTTNLSSQKKKYKKKGKKKRLRHLKHWIFSYCWLCTNNMVTIHEIHVVKRVLITKTKKSSFLKKDYWIKLNNWTNTQLLQKVLAQIHGQCVAEAMVPSGTPSSSPVLWLPEIVFLATLFVLLFTQQGLCRNTRFFSTSHTHTMGSYRTGRRYSLCSVFDMYLCTTCLFLLFWIYVFMSVVHSLAILVMFPSYVKFHKILCYDHGVLFLYVVLYTGTSSCQMP